jgi:hypothetical protein
MEHKLKILEAVADPKDGQLIVHYKLNGGQTQTYKPAVEIRRRERALGQYEKDPREFFANFLKGKSASGNPVMVYSRLAWEREDFADHLDVLRLVEIHFKLGTFRENPALLSNAISTLLVQEGDLCRLK